MRKWFISDIHFGHFNVINYSNRPFLARQEGDQIIAGNSSFPVSDKYPLDGQIRHHSVKWMNETIIQNWNNSIQPEDLVYFVGDFAFVGTHQMQEILARLNGTKILIKGNHDRSAKIMKEVGFTEVYDQLDIEVGGYSVHLSHYPYVDLDFSEVALLRPNILKYSDKELKLPQMPPGLDYDGQKEWLLKFIKYPIYTQQEGGNEYVQKMQRLISRYIGTRMVNDGKILIHGHTHSFAKRRFNMINVSVEAWNYHPASEAEIVKLIEEYFQEINPANITPDQVESLTYYGKLNQVLRHQFKDDSLKPLAEVLGVLSDFNSAQKADKPFQTHHIPREYSPEWYNLNIKLQGFIPLPKLEHGKFYQGNCRNASWAYFDAGTQEFYYIRSKFGSRFVESIRPIEKDDGFDLFIPFGEYQPSDEELSLFWSLK